MLGLPFYANYNHNQRCTWNICCKRYDFAMPLSLAMYVFYLFSFIPAFCLDEF